jgi:hypothetical protein
MCTSCVLGQQARCKGKVGEVQGGITLPAHTTGQQGAAECQESQYSTQYLAG